MFFLLYFILGSQRSVGDVINEQPSIGYADNRCMLNEHYRNIEETNTIF